MDVFTGISAGVVGVLLLVGVLDLAGLFKWLAARRRRGRTAE